MNTKNSLGTMAVVTALTVAGCAHLPDAQVAYYLPQSKVSFKVIRTVTCDKDNHVLMAEAVTPAVTHSADRVGTNKQMTIPLAKLRGTFSDTDVKVERYDDGRLKSFNGTNTGQGEAILKTVVTIAAAAFAFNGGPKSYPKECAEIKKIGEGKPITLTYESVVKLGDGEIGKEQPIKADTTTSVLVEAHELEPAVGHVCATFAKKVPPETVPATYTPKGGASTAPASVSKGGDVLLWAREPGRAQMKVTSGGANSCQLNTIWDDEVLIAQFGLDYPLPIPPPAPFGKGALAASFAESGALTSVQFVSNTGAGQALNVLGAAQTATAGPTTAQKAAEVKAEADLIAQQQRLVQCLADATTCKP